LREIEEFIGMRDEGKGTFSDTRRKSLLMDEQPQPWKQWRADYVPLSKDSSGIFRLSLGFIFSLVFRVESARLFLEHQPLVVVDYQAYRELFL